MTRPKPPKPNARLMRLALARHFNWFQSTMMPEWFIDGGIADLIFVTRSRYVTEIEIKVSLSDWKADATKDKWKKPRPNIARFYYAVPESLVDRIPADLPPFAGILAVRFPEHGYPQVREVRAAKRFKAEKMAASEINHIHERCYFRFWRAELYPDRRRSA